MRRDSSRKPSGRTGGRRETRQSGPLTPSRVTVLVLTALAIVLIAENTRPVKIRILVPVVTMPLYLALLGMFVLGGLCGALLLRSRGR